MSDIKDKTLKATTFVIAQEIALHALGFERCYAEAEIHVADSVRSRFVVNGVATYTREKPLVEMTSEELNLRREALKGMSDYLWKERRETEKEFLAKTAQAYVAVVDPHFGDADIIPVSPHGNSCYHEFEIKLVEGRVVIEVDTELVASAAPPMIMQFGKPVTLSNYDEACVFTTEADAKAWVAEHPSVLEAARDKANDEE